jgi:phosphatidylglycerol:prolipoprotein diacylglycerol transferase
VQFPVYLWVGPLPIHPHWVFETLAYIVGGRLYAHLKAQSGDPIGPADRWWIVAAAFVGAALGSKLLVLVDHPTLTLEHLAEPLALLDGKTVVGALVGAWLAVEATKRRIGITRATGDVFAIPLTVGIAIGRIGCFLTGLSDNTHGLPTNLPWPVEFVDGIPRHPAQLYEIA